LGARDVSDLTERERQVLRLLARGHDIKSAARDLSISSSAVSDRLRQARRKLGVSTSRQAARILIAHESDYRNDVHRFLGIRNASNTAQPSRANTFARNGLVMTSLVVAAAFVSTLAINQPGSGAGDAPSLVGVNGSHVQPISCGERAATKSKDGQPGSGNTYFDTSRTGRTKNQPVNAPSATGNVPPGSSGSPRKAEFCATF
jgi:DNA-binding CsgD family transcriptional regulator